MIFITPMPPTSSEIKAIQEISSVIVLVVSSIVFLIVSEFLVKKSFLPCLAVKISVKLCSAICAFTLSFTLTVIDYRCLSPVSLFMTAVYVENVRRVLESANILSFLTTTPMILKGRLLKSTVLPNGSSFAKNCSLVG